MKKYLIYIIILLVLAFVGSVFYFTWQNKNSDQVSAVGDNSTETKSATKEELKIPKVDSFQVPILMYHYIRVAPEGDTLGQNLSVTPDNFDIQIKGLVDDGYASIKMSDLVDPELKAISQAIHDQKKPIVLTFDDGYEDAYTNALPVLQKYQMIGTFYIIRNYVGRSEYMSQDQIDKMAADGMEIGSHTLTHPNLASLSEEDQYNQIHDSKDNATTFCYPAGKYNDTTLNLVEGAGYTTAVTTNIGIASEKSDMFELPRVRVEDGSSQTLLDKIGYAFEYGSN